MCRLKWLGSVQTLSTGFSFAIPNWERSHIARVIQNDYLREPDFQKILTLQDLRRKGLVINFSESRAFNFFDLTAAHTPSSGDPGDPEMWKTLWGSLVKQQTQREDRLVVCTKLPMGGYLKTLVATVDVSDPDLSLNFLQECVYGV